MEINKRYSIEDFVTENSSWSRVSILGFHFIRVCFILPKHSEFDKVEKDKIIKQCLKCYFFREVHIR